MGIQRLLNARTNSLTSNGGFLGNDSVRDENGYGITVSYWKDERSARAWKKVQEHLHTQSTERKKWYKNYSVHVVTVNRAYSG